MRCNIIWTRMLERGATSLRGGGCSIVFFSMKKGQFPPLIAQGTQNTYPGDFFLGGWVLFHEGNIPTAFNCRQYLPTATKFYLPMVANNFCLIILIIRIHNCSFSSMFIWRKLHQPPMWSWSRTNGENGREWPRTAENGPPNSRDRWSLVLIALDRWCLARSGRASTNRLGMWSASTGVWIRQSNVNTNLMTTQSENSRKIILFGIHILHSYILHPFTDMMKMTTTLNTPPPICGHFWTIHPNSGQSAGFFFLDFMCKLLGKINGCQRHCQFGLKGRLKNGNFSHFFQWFFWSFYSKFLNIAYVSSISDFF